MSVKLFWWQSWERSDTTAYLPRFGDSELDKRTLIWWGFDRRNFIVSVEEGKVIVLFIFFASDEYIFTETHCTALSRSLASEATRIICTISDFEGIDWSFLGLIRHSSESAAWGQWNFTHFEEHWWSRVGWNDTYSLSMCWVEPQILQWGRLVQALSLCQPKQLPHWGVVSLRGRYFMLTLTPKTGRFPESLFRFGYIRVKLFLSKNSISYDSWDSSAF